MKKEKKPNVLWSLNHNKDRQLDLVPFLDSTFLYYWSPLSLYLAARGSTQVWLQVWKQVTVWDAKGWKENGWWRGMRLWKKKKEKEGRRQRGVPVSECGKVCVSRPRTEDTCERGEERRKIEKNKTNNNHKDLWWQKKTHEQKVRILIHKAKHGNQD